MRPEADAKFPRAAAKITDDAAEVLGSPAKAGRIQVITGIPVTGPDVRDSVIPHMSHRARPALVPPGLDQPFDSGSPSSGAKGPRRRRSNQCLYALMGCLSERS